MIYDGFQPDSVYDGFQPTNMWIPQTIHEILATELLVDLGRSAMRQKSRVSLLCGKSHNQFVVDLILL